MYRIADAQQIRRFHSSLAQTDSRGILGHADSTPDRRKRLKLLAAAVGGGALVVMGALSINLQPDRGTTDRELQTVVADPMQTGETVTTTTPPAAPETSVAVPPVTAPPYGGG